MANPEDLIPTGWQLYTADFTGKAVSGTRKGSVMLIRDEAGMKRHLALSQAGYEAEFIKFKLYVCGSGDTLSEAVEAAVKAIYEEDV